MYEQKIFTTYFSVLVSGFYAAARRYILQGRGDSRQLVLVQVVHFKILIPGKNATLVITGISFETQEVKATESNLNIALGKD